MGDKSDLPRPEYVTGKLDEPAESKPKPPIPAGALKQDKQKIGLLATLWHRARCRLGEYHHWVGGYCSVCGIDVYAKNPLR